jgi:chemotaxis protein MotB
MPDDKLARVTGLASSNLLDPQNPLSPTNRRISIIVMTREAEERMLGGPRTVTAIETTPPEAADTASKP